MLYTNYIVKHHILMVSQRIKTAESISSGRGLAPSSTCTFSQASPEYGIETPNTPKQQPRDIFNPRSRGDKELTSLRLQTLGSTLPSAGNFDGRRQLVDRLSQGHQHRKSRRTFNPRFIPLIFHRFAIYINIELPVSNYVDSLNLLRNSRRHEQRESSIIPQELMSD